MICGNVMSEDHFSHIRKAENEKYFDLLDYLNNNYDMIISEINSLLLSNYEFLLHIVAYQSYAYLENGRLPIYEWVDDGCPYDHSGELQLIDYIDPSAITLRYFLFECYTGEKEASYESGCGWYWITFSSMLSYYSLDFAHGYLVFVLEKYISNFSDHELYDWINEIFYEDSMVYDYYSIDECDECVIKQSDLDLSLSDFFSKYLEKN